MNLLLVHWKGGWPVRSLPLSGPSRFVDGTVRYGGSNPYPEIDVALCKMPGFRTNHGNTYLFKENPRAVTTQMMVMME